MQEILQVLIFTKGTFIKESVLQYDEMYYHLDNVLSFGDVYYDQELH